MVCSFFFLFYFLDCFPLSFFFFFFNDTATTEIYTLSLHDALPISLVADHQELVAFLGELGHFHMHRSEEHTSELQSRPHLVCRLLLEKKKKSNTRRTCPTSQNSPSHVRAHAECPTESINMSMPGSE